MNVWRSNCSALLSKSEVTGEQERQIQAQCQSGHVGAMSILVGWVLSVAS